ncbi:MAG TPA: DUF4245 domain-containing protein [Mycobacteriales bacterium]|nr:DUF4245 domain-containing protein [Mycobacteriales bacterium]
MSATLWDMVRSLGVMAVVVALTLIFVPGLLHPSKSQRFAAVSYSDYTAGFKQVTGIDALVPTGLGPKWYANSANLKYAGKHAHLHIGWVTPTKDYAALEESNSPANAFIESVLGSRGLTVTSKHYMNGVAWDRRVSANGERSLTCTVGKVTVVITGSASETQDDILAAALHVGRAV